MSEFVNILFKNKLSLSKTAVVKKCSPNVIFSSISMIFVIMPYPLFILFLIFFEFLPSSDIISPRKVSSLTNAEFSTRLMDNKKGFFLQCKTPTSTIRLKDEGRRMEREGMKDGE